MNTIHFTKMHGAGNDYIYVNTLLYNIEEPEKFARLWSDRHKGIGADGLVLIGAPSDPKQADFSMRIFNADGSEAMMCGNASRCVAKYVYTKKLTRKKEIRLETLSGIRTLWISSDNITVDMGEPAFEDERFYINNKGVKGVKEVKEEGTFVSMGNPHFVIFVDDITTIDVAGDGSLLEYDERFPERCNIEFAQMLDDGSIRVRVWERGSGITLACGTGACATAAAACLIGGRRTFLIRMDGGELLVEWCDSDREQNGRHYLANHVYLTGPAEIVFEGEVIMLKS